MAPLYRADIDTDQIMPKQFLKRVERTGFGEFIFHEWRQQEDFVLNDPGHEGARILVTGPNFGAGSSREHAPWGLQDYGFDAIIAPSFADIFAQNCAQIGLLLIELPEAECRLLAEAATQSPEMVVEVDLEQQTVIAEERTFSFEIDDQLKQRLLEGVDAIGQSLSEEDAIARYELSRPAWRPVTTTRIPQTD
jgi:3-isopropylmalate/(R)-2-methylmalate dehydratase small subunit